MGFTVDRMPRLCRGRACGTSTGTGGSSTSPLCAAGIHPDAHPRGALHLSADWLSWGTYGDDYFPAVFGRRRDLAAAMRRAERLSVFMPLDLGPAAAARQPGGARAWPTCGGAPPRPLDESGAAPSSGPPSRR